MSKGDRLKRNHLYGRRWRKARINFLTDNPLCVYCQKAGIVTQATEVDHIIPHRGDPELFWDVSNWQGLCSDHHRATKQKEESIGREVGCDIDGNPNQSDHW